MRNNIQSYYNVKRLRLPLDFEIKISYDSEVRTFVEVMNGVDVGKYLVSCSGKLGRTGYNPTMMLYLILFCMSEGITSVRQMAKAARNDVRIMWLTDEMQPSHMTIARFIKNELSKSIESIFCDINKRLVVLDNINTDELYVDGTKIEAKSNKYTFVWKKAILKHREKLYIKITKTINKLIEYYACEGITFETDESYEITELKKMFAFLSSEVDKKGICFVHGKGQRKQQLQRFYEAMEQHIAYLSKYNHQISVCGNNRNSYSKTDNDATFMRMKSDHMRNGQLKPGYNVQIGVSDEYIMSVGVFQDRTDFGTFIPFMNNYKKMYGQLPLYAVADAGYGNFFNYKYLKTNNRDLFLKYTMYRKTKDKKKFREDPFRAVNFKRAANGNLVCPNEKELEIKHVSEQEINGFTKKIYNFKCLECTDCPLREQCTKSKEGRKVQINFESLDFEREAFKNLNTEKGHELKKQRSIQVEGTFGVLKEAFNFKRFKRTSLDDVKVELYLFASGFNLKKYHNKKFRVTN